MTPLPSIVSICPFSEKETYHRYHLYVESKKNDTDELIYKAEIETQTSKPLILFLNFILLLLVMFNVSKHKLSLLCFQYTICFR